MQTIVGSDFMCITDTQTAVKKFMEFGDKFNPDSNPEFFHNMKRTRKDIKCKCLYCKYSEKN